MFLFPGVFTIEDIQARWKDLRSEFAKAKAVVEGKPKSGQSGQRKTTTFKFYAQMSFLNDVNMSEKNYEYVKLFQEYFQDLDKHLFFVDYFRSATSLTPLQDKTDVQNRKDSNYNNRLAKSEYELSLRFYKFEI